MLEKRKIAAKIAVVNGPLDSRSKWVTSYNHAQTSVIREHGPYTVFQCRNQYGSQTMSIYN